MSSLCQLPAVTCGYASDEKIIIMTANGKSLEPMRDLIRDECGVNTEDKRYHIVGCENVDGFEAVAKGEKVNCDLVQPRIVQRAADILEFHPDSRAFLLECTELPPYEDAIRRKTGLPVFDAITVFNFFISGRQDNARFGEQDWQDEWDGIQEDYKYGANLTKKEKASS